MQTPETQIETAFIPAAGFGTRMRQLTADRPKPLIEVAGRTLLDRVLDRLVGAGVAHAIVNVHYRAGQIERALATRDDIGIAISDERAELLDTGGGVANALDRIGPAPFLIHNADSVWLDSGHPPALERLMRCWHSETMDCLMLLARRDTAIGFDGPGDFWIASDGRLTRRGDAPETPYVFTGVSINHPRLFADPPEGPFSVNILWDRAIAQDRLHGIVLDGRWMHVGTPEAVEQAATLLAAGDACQGDRS